MLRALLNACEISFTFETVTPTLVKEGRYEQGNLAIFHCHDSETEMNRKVRNGKLTELGIFIPGSSLRGVFRSHMERIARILSPTNPIVCNPFVEEEKADGSPGAGEPGCSSLKKDYAGSCPTCRIFGSTSQAGRISFENAEPLQGHRWSVEKSAQIAIDRFAGSVRQGPFELMLVTNARFSTKVRLRNFELWQLGLLGYVFRDLSQTKADRNGKESPDPRIQIGMGRNLDRGRIYAKSEDVAVQVVYYGRSRDLPQDGSVRGLYELTDDTAQARYRFVSREDRLGLSGLLELEAVDGEPGDIEHRFRVTNVTDLWKAATKVWNEAVDAGAFPGRMKTRAGGD